MFARPAWPGGITLRFLATPGRRAGVRRSRPAAEIAPHGGYSFSAQLLSQTQRENGRSGTSCGLAPEDPWAGTGAACGSRAASQNFPMLKTGSRLRMFCIAQINGRVSLRLARLGAAA